MVYRFAGFTLDDETFQLLKGGRVVPLEPRVFDLLAYLVLNRHRVVRKSELFECLWEGRKVSEGSLTVAVAAARKALGDSHEQPGLIETHHGRGYRFVADVSEERSLRSGSAIRTPGLREPRSFVGRDDELALLGKCLESAQQGRREVCLLSGEPGIGKSRLAEEFARIAARHRARVFTAKCLEADGAPPFWPWVQILREQFHRGDIPTGMPASVRGELARLVSDYGEAPARVETDQDPNRARFRLFDAVAYLLRASAAMSPVVLVVDDVHRADKPSLLLLEFIVRQLRDSRILVVMTDRDIETQRSPVHSELLGAICREVGSRVVLLPGLTPLEIEQFIESTGVQTSDSSNADALLELTGGNPFFLTQLVPLLGDIRRRANRSHGSVLSLPATVRDAIARQLDGLDDLTREILSVASVVGRDFSQQVLRLATRQIAGTAIALAGACEARVVSRRMDGVSEFRFSHALVRDALYERLSPRVRAEFHWRVGEALEMVRGDRPDGQILEIAHHFYNGVASGDGRRAIEVCTKAGSVASDRLAYEDAVVQYERAIELAEIYTPDNMELGCELHLALGAEQARTGERAASQGTFARAAQIARDIGDDARFARAALGTFPGFFAVEAGAPDRFAIALMQEGLQRIGDRDSELRALLLARLAMALAWADEGAQRRNLTNEAAALASASGNRTLILQVLLARWFAEWEPGAFAERWRIAEELMVRARASADRETLLLCRLFWVTCLLERGEMGEFLRQVAVFEEAAGILRQPEALWYASLLRAVHALHEGRLLDAEALSARFAEIGELVGDANVFHSRMAHKIILAWEAGETEALVEGALRGCESYPDMAGWRAAYAWSLGQAGRLDDSRREFETLARAGFDRIPKRMDWALTIAFLADVAFLIGAAKEASMLYELLMPFRGRLLVLGLCVASWGCASRHLGLLAAVMGREADAFHLLDEAITVDDSVGARAWAARSRYEFAYLASRSRDREVKDRAARMFEEAEQTAEALSLTDLKRRLDMLRPRLG